MRRLGGQVWQRARGGAADARASGIVDRPSRRSPESSEGRDARREDLVAWPAGLDVAGRGLARGQTLRKSMWVMVSLQGGILKPPALRVVVDWFNAWDTRRLAGLYDHKGRGRPPKLTIAEQEQVQQYIAQHPKDMKKVDHLIEQETSKRV